MATIKTTIPEMEIIITKLQSSSNEIERIWNSIKTEEIEQIRSLWVGKDSDAYIEKLLLLDNDVKKALEAQRLLATTFQKTKDQVLQTQQDIVSRTAGL